MSALDYGIVVVYVMLLLGAGVLVTSHIRNFKDYFLAGGALTTPLLVCTLVSTYYELDVTFSTSEVGYYNGVVAWVWYSRPYYLAILIAAFFVAPRLKKRFASMTLPDVLGEAYGNGARVTGAVACFIYSLPITVFAGMMAMFEVLGWPVWPAMIVAIAVCAIYTAVGGLWADAITDTVQFVLMSVSLGIAIPLAVKWLGGWSLLADVPAGHTTATGGLSPWLLSAYAVTALTVFVEPAFYQRIFAAKDAKSIRRALLIGVGWWAAYDWGVTIIGVLARVAVDRGMLPADLEGSHALMAICLKTLPIGLRGLFIGGVLAAAMSSVDSYALLASGNLTYDIWRPLFRPDVSDQTLVRATRIAVVVVMVVGALMSLLFSRISDAWIFMASVLTSVVFVPIAGALFSRAKPPRQAGMAGSLAGLVALIAFYVWVYSSGELDPDEESWFVMVGNIEVWREYAVLFALPTSALGFGLARWWWRPM